MDSKSEQLFGLKLRTKKSPAELGKLRVIICSVYFMRDITIPTTIVTIMMVKTPAWIKKAIESIGSTEAVRKIPTSPIPINAFPILRIFFLRFFKTQ
tara:strand:+ start:2171 stop:2461 length:291 start_codon:yes stop_codon:yes gene_type:complete